MRLILSVLVGISTFVFAEEFYFPLGDLGSVRYTVTEGYLEKIDRLSPQEEVLYTHSYTYDNAGNLTKERLIGSVGELIYRENEISYSIHDICHVVHRSQDPTLEENDKSLRVYDPSGNLIRVGETEYIYDDSHHLLQVVSNGRSTNYTYDQITGLRSSKITEDETLHYLYFGLNEMAILNEEGVVEQLRIPGLSPHKDILKPIAIETDETVYAPIHDLQGNIIKLIDIFSKEVIDLGLPGPFGENISKHSPTPWIYAGKSYDQETDLVYFGARYYLPKLRQWLTPDPACQTEDLYQYCFDDPLSYFDPDGQFVIIIPIIGGATLTEALVDAVIVAGVAWAGSEMANRGNKWIEEYNKKKQEQELAEALKNGYSSTKIDRSTKGGIDPMLPKTRPLDDEEQNETIMEQAHKDKEGKQKDGTPGNNGAQNKQFEGAVKEIEGEIGRKLSDDEWRALHDHISGQGYGYHEIVEEGIGLFNGQKPSWK